MFLYIFGVSEILFLDLLERNAFYTYIYIYVYPLRGVFSNLK